MRVPGLHKLNQSLKPARRRLRAALLTRRGRREDAIVQLSRIVDGMFRQDEIRLLYRSVKEAAGPGDIAEIGSWKGRSTVVMGLALGDRGEENCRIFAIDHHVGSEEHRNRIAREGSTFDDFRFNIQRMGVSEFIEPLVMKSGEGSRVLAERGIRLRFLFIDGAHDEASVREDIRNFLPLMHPEATIALHDCEEEGGFPGVWKAFEQELAPKVKILERASSLLIARLLA